MAGWLLAVLVAAQALGVMHSAAHALRSPSGMSAEASVASAPTDHGGKPASLFGWHDAGTQDCRVFDQLLHGDLALPGVPAMEVAVPDDRLEPGVEASRELPARRRFCARDPPSGVA